MIEESDLEEIRNSIEFNNLDPRYYYEFFTILFIKNVDLKERIRIVLRKLKGTGIKLNFKNAFKELDITDETMATFLGLVNEIENEELPRSNLMTLIWINQAYNMGTKLSPNRFKGVVNRVVEKMIKREN